MMEIVIACALPTIVVVGCIWQRNNEKREWNNGICKATGGKWKLFDYDSQGGRGYKSGKEYCWISYGVDK